MRKLAYIIGGIFILLAGSLPLQLSLCAMKKGACGLTILLMFFAMMTGLYGFYLLRESGRNYIIDE
jgi:hypothetical protein